MMIDGEEVNFVVLWHADDDVLDPVVQFHTEVKELASGRWMAWCGLHLLRDGPDDIVLVEQDFKGATERNVTDKVEQWAREQYERAVLKEFYVDPNGSPN